MFAKWINSSRCQDWPPLICDKVTRCLRLAKATLSEFYYSAPKPPWRNFPAHSQIIYLRRRTRQRGSAARLFVRVRFYADVFLGVESSCRLN